MEVSKNINEGFVDTFYKKPTREESNRYSHNRNMRGRSSLSNTNPYMYVHAGNGKRIYVDRPIGKLQLFCRIHDPVHYSDQFKVLSDFRKSYYARRPIKDSKHNNSKIIENK